MVARIGLAIFVFILARGKSTDQLKHVTAIDNFYIYVLGISLHTDNACHKIANFLYFSFVVSGFQDGYTMEQAERREPMPEYPNPGTLHKFMQVILIATMGCFNKWVLTQFVGTIGKEVIKTSLF